MALNSVANLNKHLFRLFFFGGGSGRVLSHCPALFKTQLVMKREILVKQEAAVSDKSLFANKAVLLADCINRNGVKLLY